MAQVHDVAAYILGERRSMTAMKLQKLVYYAQVWSLVWEEDPLFPERIEAWANGPVSPDLYKVHRGAFRLDRWPKGDPGNLSEQGRGTVDAVLKFYGDMTAQKLSDMTHAEEPWSKTREGLNPRARSNREITHALMHEYYSGL